VVCKDNVSDSIEILFSDFRGRLGSSCSSVCLLFRLRFMNFEGNNPLRTSISESFLGCRVKKRNLESFEWFTYLGKQGIKLSLDKRRVSSEKKFTQT